MSLLLSPTSLEHIDFDAEGFMTDASQWTPEIAEAIAEAAGMALTPRHWAAIEFARADFAATGESPTLRRITKMTDITTKEIYQLFPGGPGKLVAKVAGLKKPTGCI